MAQEEESREKEDDISDRNEYCLSLLLNDAFMGKGFQKIKEMVQESRKYPPQKFNKRLLNQLDKLLKKELDKNAFSNVSLLLKCVQLFCSSDPQEGVNLFLQQGLIPKMVTWFERTREFLSLIEPKENEFLANLVKDFFNTALIISRSNSEGTKQLLDSFLPYLGQLATECDVNCVLRQEALRTLNILFDNAPAAEKKKLSVSEEMSLLLKEFARSLLEVGDYDIQMAVLEAICKVTLKKKWRDYLAHNWFEDQHITKAFKEIKNRDFDTDSRKFLNELNESLGDKRRVCSIPCKAAHADTNELHKPPDDKLEEFWIDFNFGTESISFYLENPESALWESVQLPKEDVNSFHLQEEGGEKILKMLMKNPTTINQKEVTKIQIHFDSQFDILTPLFKVMGNDKMMVIMDKGENHESEDQPQHNPTVANSHLERKEDIVGTDSLSDILISQPSDQSHAAEKTSLLADAMTARENQQAADKHTSQASSNASAASLTCPINTPNAPLLNASALKAFPVKQKDKTVEPSVEGETLIQFGEAVPLEDDKLEKTNRARSSSKQMSDVKKDAYEFENSSDPVVYEMVSAMKQKVFVQKSISHRSFEKTNMKINKSEKRPSANYKSHLFSETNQETPSSSTSEKSWILSSQKKSTPKTSDYTRKKPRIRSTLKVLPLSSPSSDSGHHAKRVRYSALHREKAKKRMNSNMQNFTPVHPTGVSSTPFSHVRQNDLEMVDATLPLNNHSYSVAGRSTKYEAATTALFQKDNVSKAKRKLPDWSPDLNRKDLKGSERTPGSEQSTSIPFEPRKLFNSIEMEEETPKGQHLDKSEDDEFVSKILEEEIDGSGAIAAFERFTSDLNKMFLSRHKAIENYTQNILKASGKNLSALLNQIHQSRLNQLENFHKIVLRELVSLEKKTEFLMSLEKDIVEFWTEQSKKLKSKLNAFCIHQMQRMESMDSVLEEPGDESWETEKHHLNVKLQKTENDKEL